MQSNLALKIQNFTSTEYMEYLFSGLEGNIFRCQKKNYGDKEFFKSHAFDSTKLIKQVSEGQADTYVSMNSFFYSKEDKRPSRKVSCLKRINALYVDIDCYKEGMRNDIVLADLEDRVFGYELPYPTFVVDSGRGLYLIWKFKKSEDRNALPRWERVQDFLINSLEGYGADPAARDAARVLRIPGTINSKSNTVVKVLRFYDVEYSLHQMMKDLELGVPDKREQRKASQKQINYATILAAKSGVELPDFNSRSETYKFIEKYQDVAPRIKSTNNISYFDKDSPNRLIKGYLEDLHTLFSMRRGADCKREIALFLCRYWNNLIYNDDSMALRETLSLNASFAFPFNENYVITNTKSAVKRIEEGLRYNYRKKTLIEILDITSDEMKFLSFLRVSSESEKKEKLKKKNHNSYVLRLLKKGETTKSSKISKRLDDIRELQHKGFSAVEIQQKLNISRATYFRMLDKLSDEKQNTYVQEELPFEVVTEMPASTEEVIPTGMKKAVETARKLIRGAVSFFNPPIWDRGCALSKGCRENNNIINYQYSLEDYGGLYPSSGIGNSSSVVACRGPNPG